MEIKWKKEHPQGLGGRPDAWGDTIEKILGRFKTSSLNGVSVVEMEKRNAHSGGSSLSCTRCKSRVAPLPVAHIILGEI